MAIFCDCMIFFIGAVLMVIKAGLVPIEEISELLLPYTGTMFLVMIGFFVLKYVVFGIRTFRDIRYMSTPDYEPGIQSYLVLGAYPVCDVARLLVALGLLSAMFNQLVFSSIVFNAFADHVILILLVLAAMFIDYFCKDTETLLSNVIPTAVFVLATVIFSKGMFLQGLRLM